ncbi:MAG: hypothetical protein SFH39_03295 [Candidatus Magnetobacterium sp. LHC-1]|nr:hypothetical protein [Nitrospirota bacterium]
MDELSIVGVGLLPSRNDTKRHMGHMWLRWYDDKEGKFQYRGYYPVVADIPPDIADSELRKYFCNKGVKVRGCYMDDIEARESEESMNKHQYLVKCWDILGEQYDMVLQDCFLLEDEIFVVSGFYSCDEDIDDADNCSSWAIKKLIKA